MEKHYKYIPKIILNFMFVLRLFAIGSLIFVLVIVYLEKYQSHLTNWGLGNSINIGLSFKICLFALFMHGIVINTIAFIENIKRLKNQDCLYLIWVPRLPRIVTFYWLAQAINILFFLLAGLGFGVIFSKWIGPQFRLPVF